MKTLIFILFFILPLPTFGIGEISGADLFSGRSITLSSGRRGKVVVFMSARCPCSHSHIEVLRRLAGEFPDFKFFGVHSNTDEPKELATAYFQRQNLPFPVIEDSATYLADEFKAFKTPHAFLLDASGKIVYRGGVTNSNDGVNAKENWLKNAMVDVAAGRPVGTGEGRTLGCEIKRRGSGGW